MGTFDKCGKCGEYDFMNTHRCQPLFYARHDYEDPSDWTRVYARDAEQAAEHFAGQADAYDAHFRAERTVIVRDAKGEYRAYAVEGEMVPSYSAHRADGVEIVLDPADEPEPDDEPEPEQDN